MKLDINKIKPVFTKNDTGLLDPPRYPKVIVPYENQMKASFKDASSQMIANITKKMVDIKSK